MASLADDARGLLDALGVERAHVLGYSLGSAVAQELALAAPERVASLVLYCTWARTDGFERAVITGLSHPWRTGDVEAALGALGIAFSPQLLDSPELGQLVEQLLPLFPSTEQQIRTTVEQWDADLAHNTLDRLGEISAPTLVIAGEQDLLTPPWHGRQVAEALPNARSHMFTGPGSSHALGVERAEEFVPLVMDFLAENPLPWLAGVGRLRARNLVPRSMDGRRYERIGSSTRSARWRPRVVSGWAVSRACC